MNPTKCIICGNPYDFTTRWFQTAARKGEAQTCSPGCYSQLYNLPEDEVLELLTKELDRIEEEIGHAQRERE